MDFIRGLSYPLRGFAILRRHPGLMRLWLAPIVITWLALGLSVWLAFAYSDDLLALVWAPPPKGGALEILLSALWWALRAVAFVIGLSLMVVTCIVASTLVAAPFNDALSEAIELREAGIAGPPFSLARLVRDVLRSVRVELTKLLVFACVMGPLFVVSLLAPGVGQLLYVLVGTLFTALYFAFDYIDWPASRRGFDLRARLALLRARPLLTLGFGFGVWACLFVPLLNLAFMPLAVAGGTMLFLELERELAP